MKSSRREMADMLHVVTGGSGSGKSAFAEELICNLHQEGREKKRSSNPQTRLIYIATMMPYGKETKKKIEKHQKSRAGKEFETIECYRDLEQMITEQEEILKDADVLLECMSNLVANEMFADLTEEDTEEDMPQVQKFDDDYDMISKMISGVKRLINVCREVVIVTNEVFSDGAEDTNEMRAYKQVLGNVNQEMAKLAASVTEVIYGCPIEKENEGLRTEKKKETSGTEKKKEAAGEVQKHMQLIIGGAFQGKTEYARKDYPDCTWIDGKTCELNEIETCGGIYHFHEWVRRMMLEENTQERENDSAQIEQDAKEIVDMICRSNTDIIIVSDEVGYGLVPVDAFERAYREQVGRICTLLAKRAQDVKRVVCGIPMNLKSE